MRRRRTFVDKQHEADFRRCGFVMVRVDDTCIEALNAANARIQCDGEGFHTTAADPDMEVRTEASRAIAEILAPILDLLTGQRFTMGAFVIKEPTGDSDVIVHTDPTSVDEKRWRSVSMWCPLHDVGPDNGMLWALEGSHRETPAFRPPIAWAAQDWSQRVFAAASDDRKLPLPMTAGDVLLFDQ